MVDPRGGALTLGLGLLDQLAVIPHHDTWSEDKAKRTLKIAPAGLPVAGIDERTALIRAPDGGWHGEVLDRSWSTSTGRMRASAPSPSRPGPTHAD